jgi:coenzyme F420 hydrogenase subunit beta
MELTACKELETKVIKEKLCTLCGACTGMCPYLIAYRGRIVLRDECHLSQGRCHHFCPRVSVNLNDVHRVIFGKPYPWNSLGNVRELCIARSTDKAMRSKGQYGGVVTTLISFALKKGFIDSAVLTRSGDDGFPEGRLATTEEEILDCAGSSYVASPTVGAFNREAQAKGIEKVGVVGTSCQVLALSKMRAAPLDVQENAKRLGLTLGLFCTWALPYEEFVQCVEERVSLSDIIKIDIPPPPANVFEIYTASHRISVPLEEIRKIIKPACLYCIDMTAEFADISVGAAEGITGWNTVIVRSEKGADLFRKAVGHKVLEVDPLPEQSLEHLKEASLTKKKRGLKNIIQKTGKTEDLLYLKSDARIVKEFLND